MNQRAAITVLRPPDEIERLWRSPEHGSSALADSDAEVAFRKAPGDRGTEIHVDLGRKPPGGKVGEVVQGLVGAVPLAKVKDDLRRFKQLVETGEIPRSDGSPEGEQAGRKLKQRPAHPVGDAEKAGAR
jgi:uncharacterized membrane protein